MFSESDLHFQLHKNEVLNFKHCRYKACAALYSNSLGIWFEMTMFMTDINHHVSEFLKNMNVNIDGDVVQI